MNWMGGARNRVKFQSERKTQKDFFERRRLNLGNSVLHKNQGMPKKRRVSQDLMALHTVNVFHSGVPASSATGYKAPVKAVDLDRFKSCTQHFKEVDIGPLSPTQPQSKLLLMDCKGNNLKKTSATVTGLETNNSERVDNQFSSVTHHSEGNTNKQETWVKPEIRPFSFRKTSVSNKTGSFDSKSNPFVAEDFPFTPLTKPEASKHKRHKDRKHRVTHAKDNQGKYVSKDKSKRYMYTSTPYDAVLNRSFIGNQTLNLDLSPIGVQNMNKTGYENSIGAAATTQTRYDEISRPERMFIDAAGDRKHEKFIEGDDMNQNGSSHLRNNALLQASISNNEGQNSYSWKSDQKRHFKDQQSSHTSTDFIMSNDSMNLSGSQFQSGLSLFKHGHVKRSEVSGKASSLDKFRQNISTPSALNQSTLGPSQTPTRPVIPTKPNFHDFDEEFRFTPYKEISFSASQDIPILSTPCKNPRLSSSSYNTPVKRVDHSNQAVSSNVLGKRPTSHNMANLVAETPKQPDIMNLYKEQRKISHIGGSKQRLILKESSPKIADKFPSHLQTKITDTSTTAKRQEKTLEDSRNAKVSNQSTRSHRDMSEVLKEMQDMETEEDILHKTSQENRKVLDDAVIYEETNEPTSMSFEADKYFESEQHEVMEDKLEENEVEDQKINNDANKPTNTECKEYIAVPVNATDEFSPDITMVDNSKDESHFFETSQGFDVNTFSQYYPPADKIDELLENSTHSEQMSEDPFDSKTVRCDGNASVTQTETQAIDHEALESHTKAQVGMENDGCAQEKDICKEKAWDRTHENIIENMCKATREDGSKDLNKDIELNHTNKADTSVSGFQQKNDNHLKHFQIKPNSESGSFDIHTLPTNSKVITPNGLYVQDPEVSSGKNRGVQCSFKQPVSDKGTSPFTLASKDFTDIGVQCDIIYTDFGLYGTGKLSNIIESKQVVDNQLLEKTDDIVIKDMSGHNKEE